MAWGGSPHAESLEGSLKIFINGLQNHPGFRITYRSIRRYFFGEKGKEGKESRCPAHHFVRLLREKHPQTLPQSCAEAARIFCLQAGPRAFGSLVVILPAELVKVHKVPLPTAAAPGRIERRHRTVCLAQRGVSSVDVAIGFGRRLPKLGPSNKANAADCQSSAILRRCRLRSYWWSWLFCC